MLFQSQFSNFPTILSVYVTKWTNKQTNKTYPVQSPVDWSTDYVHCLIPSPLNVQLTLSRESEYVNGPLQTNIGKVYTHFYTIWLIYGSTSPL